MCQLLIASSIRQCSIYIILQKIMIKKSTKALLNRQQNYKQVVDEVKTPFPVLNKVHFKICNDDQYQFAQRKSRQSKKSYEKHDFSVQQIQLDKSKWFIFNEGKDELKVYANFNSFRKNTITQVKKTICKIKTDQNNMRINISQPNQQVNTFRPVTTVASQKQLKISNRLKISQINNVNRANQKFIQKPIQRKVQGFKSSRSCKSVKSNCTSKPLLQDYRAQVLIKQQMVVDVAKQQNRFLLVTKLYDQIELLNPYLMKGYHLDLYEEYQLADPPIKTQIMKVNEGKTQIDIPIVKNQTIGTQVKQQLNEPQQQNNLITQENKAMQLEERQAKQQIISFQQLTTKATQIYPQEKQMQEPMVVQQQQKYPAMISLLEEFKQFKQVRLIRIDHNSQTALFPCKSMPQYIRPIPSTSTLHKKYQNNQIISFLNHLLFCNSAIIQTVFEKPSQKGFRCNLYDQKRLKSIAVNDLFPFDANFYPLYGHFDHFIWFSVLIKCIAKLKGSYLAVNELQHHHIYELLTGQSLVKYNLNWIESKALKTFKLLLKQAQTKSIFITVKHQKTFYKIHKIETSKLLKKKHNKQCSNLSSAVEENYKTLSNFLKKQKKVHQKNEQFQNTILFLRGFQGNKKLSYKTFLEEQFEVYIASNQL